MIPQAKIKMTPMEYLEFEKKSELKHEYFDGEVFAMVGATLNHNRIARNLTGLLWHRLSGTPCEVFASDMRVKIAAIEKYAYPDIVIVCDQIEMEDAGLDCVLNPLVIIEILSDSTEAYDRGQKFIHYQLIDSFQEYILISQHGCDVVKYVRNRNDANWIYSSYADISQVITIESIDSELRLSDIYHRVELKK